MGLRQTLQRLSEKERARFLPFQTLPSWKPQRGTMGRNGTPNPDILSIKGERKLEV